MQTKYIKRPTNIYEYPEKIRNPKGTITFGDLHGNSVKFLYSLIQNGVVSCPEKSYLEFVNLYECYAKVIAYRFKHMENMRRMDLDIIEHENNIEFIELVQLDLETEKQIVSDIKEKKRIAQLELEQELNSLADKGLALGHLVTYFHEFCKTLEVKNNSVAIRLLGDEVADRGACDYFTLVFLQLLQCHHVNLTILLSNHGIEFVAAYERLSDNKSFEPLGLLINSQKVSFYGLRYLLDDKVINGTQLLKLINSCYKPYLKLMDYTFNETGIRLFTHAPVDFKIIRCLANVLDVFYNELTKEALGATIDKINTVFQNFVTTNTIRSQFDMPNYPGGSLDTLEEYIDTWSFLYIVWNRFNSTKDTDEKRPGQLYEYTVDYMHCHDDYKSKRSYIDNLNTGCGKSTYAMIKKNEALLKDILVSKKTKAEAERFLLNAFDYMYIESTEIQLHDKYTLDEIQDEFDLFNSEAADLYYQEQEDFSDESYPSAFKMI